MILDIHDLKNIEYYNCNREHHFNSVYRADRCNKKFRLIPITKIKNIYCNKCKIFMIYDLHTLYHDSQESIYKYIQNQTYDCCTQSNNTIPS